MSTYIVKGGDSLSAIARRLGLDGWQDLYNQNKSIIGSNPNLIRPGQVLTYGTGGSSSTTTTSGSGTLPPSTTVGNTIAGTIEDPTRENFIAKYGTEEDLRPDAMFSAVAEERVNPEQLRLAAQQIKGLDWQRAIGGSGGRVSGSTMAARQNALAQMERQRREAVNQYTQSQKDLFNTWYNKEMNAYMTSQAPSAYTLGKYGLEMPGAEGMVDYDTSQRYEYNPAFDLQNVFRLGGYSRPATMYNMPTPIS